MMMKRFVSNITFGVVLVIAWIAFLLSEPLLHFIDDHTTPQPWFEARLEVGVGTVHYTREINRRLRGEWTAVVEIPSGQQWVGECDRSGRWTYRPATRGTISMGFERFTGGCPQPEGMHRVCTDYVMADVSGRTRHFGPFCSEPYKPEGR